MSRVGKVECLAMILAGGRGSRLGALTRYYPKASIHIGGKYRIIDFSLCNCINSEISDVGILSQYFSNDLHSYVNSRYDHSLGTGGIHMLPSSCNNAYKGTADAIIKNIGFIEKLQPKYVLVLAGDHVYNMDYRKMISFHKETGAGVTVGSVPVFFGESPRLGILDADDDGRVHRFAENQSYHGGNLASMGIYIFNWSLLKKYLFPNSPFKRARYALDRDILPGMLHEGEIVYTHIFGGYWRSIETVDNLWEANMDQIDCPVTPVNWPGEKESPGMPCVTTRETVLANCIVSDDCAVFGRAERSVLGTNVTISRGAEVIDSVIMHNVYIGSNVKINKAIVGPRAVIMDNTEIGAEGGGDVFVDRWVCPGHVSLVSPWMYVEERARFQMGSHVSRERVFDAGYSAGNAVPPIKC